MQFVELNDVKLRTSYRPEQYITDNNLLKEIKQRPIKEQHGIAELLVGAFKKHEFYASVGVDTKASFSTLSNVPFFFLENLYENLGSQLAEAILANGNRSISIKNISLFEFDLAMFKLN